MRAMRWSVLAVSSVVLVVAAGGAASAEPCTNRAVGGMGDPTSVVTECSPSSASGHPSESGSAAGSGSGSGTSPSDGGADSSSADRPAVFWGTRLVIGPVRGGPDGLTCFETVPVGFPTASERDAHQAQVTALIAAVEANSQTYLRCNARPEGDDDAALLPAPEQLAEAFIHAVAFEPPDPRIRPGYAITGLPAFLEPGGTDAIAPITRPDSPYGTFHAEAEPTLRVHWGDGAVHAVTDERGWIEYGSRSGGPWPHGDITFVYRDPGTVTVSVVREWAFHWSFSAGPSGVLVFPLAGQAGPLPIDEVQAVRVR